MLNYFFTETDEFTNRIEEIVAESDNIRDTISNVISDEIEKTVERLLDERPENDYDDSDVERCVDEYYGSDLIDRIETLETQMQTSENYFDSHKDMITSLFKRIEILEKQLNRKPWYKFW